MKRVKGTVLAALVGLASIGAAQTTIYEQIQHGKEFKILRGLLAKSALGQDMLKWKGPITFFAPTDAAFAKVPAETMKKILTEAGRIDQLILMHTCDGRWTKEKLVGANGKHIKTRSLIGVQVLSGEKGLTIAGSPVLTADGKASNGVLHTLGRVVVPPFDAPIALPARKEPPPQESGAFLVGPIAKGRSAPMFTLPRADGGTLSLAEACAGKKATLVYFWYIGCPPCRASLPKLEELYKKLQPSGFEMVTVNMEDTPAAITAFFKEKGYSLPVVLNGKGKEDLSEGYVLTMGFPTYVLVSSDGHVLDSFSGMNIERLERALGSAGLKV